jgi:hypothetical protein
VAAAVVAATGQTFTVVVVVQEVFRPALCTYQRTQRSQSVAEVSAETSKAEHESLTEVHQALVVQC